MSKARIKPIPRRPAGRWLILGLLLYSAQLVAHPMEYHREPLDPQTVERVLDSLDRMANLVERGGSPDSMRPPDGAMGLPALAASLESGLRAMEETGEAGGPSLTEVLAASGYADPETAPYLWQLEAERVLETWEVYARGLSMETVNAEFARYKEERTGLTEEEALDREAELFRDEQLVRTTSVDLEFITRYRTRLESLALRLGAGN